MLSLQSPVNLEFCPRMFFISGPGGFCVAGHPGIIPQLVDIMSPAEVMLLLPSLRATTQNLPTDSIEVRTSNAYTPFNFSLLIYTSIQASVDLSLIHI